MFVYMIWYSSATQIRVIFDALVQFSYRHERILKPIRLSLGLLYTL